MNPNAKPGGRRLYVPLEVGKEIRALTLAPGQPFVILLAALLIAMLPVFALSFIAGACCEGITAAWRSGYRAAKKWGNEV